jgi:uncharacterized membrane protein
MDFTNIINDSKNIIKLSIIVLLLDIITLFFIGPYYGKMINKIQSSPMEMNYTAATIAYIFIVMSIYIFIIKNNSIITNKKHLFAFLLGICIYGLYETTNKTLIKNWTWEAVIIDTTWGGLLYLISTYLFYKYI